MSSPAPARQGQAGQVVEENKARVEGPETIGEWETWRPTGALDLDVLLRKVRNE